MLSACGQTSLRSVYGSRSSDAASSRFLVSSTVQYSAAARSVLLTAGLNSLWNIAPPSASLINPASLTIAELRGAAAAWPPSAADVKRYSSEPFSATPNRAARPFTSPIKSSQMVPPSSKTVSKRIPFFSSTLAASHVTAPPVSSSQER